MKTSYKAIDILSKINGQVITLEDWLKASDYAKSDLKRKANVVVDEIIEELYGMGNANRFNYWKEVKQEIEKL